MKQIAKILGIFIVAFVILGGAYKATKMVKQHFERQRIAQMYTTITKTGKLRVGKNRYVYLTDYGRSRLQSNLTFKSTKQKKHVPATAYVVDTSRQVTYDYVNKTTLPKPLTKGTVINLTAPFGLSHGPKFRLDLLAGTDNLVRYPDINISLPEKHNKRSLKLNVIVGYNVSKKGELLQDAPKLAPFAGQTVPFEIQNQGMRTGKFKKNDFKKLAKAPNLDLPASWLKAHPNSLQVNFETLRSATKPTLRYQATIDGKKVTIDPTIKLVKTRSYEKDWQATFKPSAQVLAQLNQSKSKRLKVTAAYYGTYVDAYYYPGNSLSGVYTYRK
ncbi:MAG: hypothetical protein LKF36_14085 [Lactobacillus sp.]|jgi:hypothetical protein|nr:hypothetical protein [Lactobacillus sp.]